MLPLLLQSSTSNTTAAIMIGFGAMLVMYLSMRGKRKKKDPLQNQEYFSLSRQRTLERDMQNLVVELSDMARQISAQLDTRSARLELLIKEADEKIAQLRQPTTGQPHLAPPAQEHADAEPAATVDTAQPATDPIDPRHAEIYALADAGHSPMDIARQLDRPSGEVQLILALRPQGGRDTLI